jgi:hypothetical protein
MPDEATAVASMKPRPRMGMLSTDAEQDLQRTSTPFP